MGLSRKLAVLSATVMSTAIVFKLSTPFITEFAISDIPTIWTSLISWFKPPYLYVVINCLIITIVASSRLQSKLDDSNSTFQTPVLPPTEPVNIVLPVELPPVYEPKFEPDFCTPQFSDELRDGDLKIANEEIKKNMVDNKYVISMSTWTPSKINRVDLSFPVEKPPASARFSHRKPAKATSEGGRTLGVAKPKRQDTLESTWKTITEGRSVPLTRHLRKSDTWETHGQGRHDRNSDKLSSDHHYTKSDTFDVNRGRGGISKSPPPQSKLSRSGGSGRLRKDPSLGQEELNRRVEAFIRKFNEDMRLQRQESLNQYMEMINRGAH